MTVHARQHFTGWERVAGLDDGPPATNCGIEAPDVEPPDQLTGDLARVDCPACLAPTPAEQEQQLREYLARFSTSHADETIAGWALRELKQLRRA